MSNDDLREELANVAASLRAYLEWQQATGAGGIPRRGPGTSSPGTSSPSRIAAPSEPPELPPAARTNMAPIDPPDEPPPAHRHVASHEPPTTSHHVASHEPPKVSRSAAPEIPSADPPVSRSTATKAAPPDDPPKPNDLPASVREHRPLPIIEEEVRTCVRCDLSQSRTHTAFSRGNPEAKLCFVGEAPGADEDAQGVPFVGRAGQLLDRMIAAMGLDPERDTYICNIIKCRPPNNRRPEPLEIEACIPYLHEQLAIVNPKVIVALGNTAVAALLQSKLGITKVRGSWKLYRGRVPVMPTYHPSYLLRPSAQQAEAKRQAWEDLQEVMRELGLPRKKG